MSGVAAIFAGPGREASPATVAQMVQEMATRGPHGASSWSDGPAAIGFLAFHTTPEAVLERQPYVDRLTGSVIALDGRLDNRDDLMAALRGDVSAADGDAAFFAAAYRRWGRDAFGRLIGDFAAIIWDPRRRFLLCARDVMGMRPLCHARSRDGQILVASEARALLATGLIDAEVNDAHALEHLAGQGLHRTETLFRGIERVPPAHLLTFSATATDRSRFWHFDDARPVRYRSDGDYAAHARDLLGRVVRAQSRSRRGVGVLLSGGVDSSIVATVTAAAGIDCEAFSVSFPGQECDETAYAAAVARGRMAWRTLPYRPSPAAWYDEQASTYRELPDYPNGASLTAVREAAAAADRRVLLTGVGGDEWFTGSPYRQADLIKTGAWRTLLTEHAADIRRRGWPAAWTESTRCGIWPVLPGTLRAMVKMVRRGSSAVPEWIEPAAATAVNLADRIAMRVAPHRGETFANADLRAIAESGYQLHSEEMEDRAASRAGVEQRHPLYDRRVIEFGYGLPETQRWRDGATKFVLRGAAQDLVPDTVRLRRDKADFSGNFVDALLARGSAEFPHLVARGWIRPRVAADLSRHLAAWRAAGDIRFWRAMSALWMMHAVECWLVHSTRRLHVQRADSDSLTTVVS